MVVDYRHTALGLASARAREVTGGEIEHLYSFRPTKRTIRVVCRGADHPFYSEQAAINWLHLQADRWEEAAARARHPAGKGRVIGRGDPPEPPPP